MIALRSGDWSWFKVLITVKVLQVQYEQDAQTYSIYGYDGFEKLACTIWRGTVPSSIIMSGYSQAQNDADLADFEAGAKVTANKTVEPRAKDGRMTVRTSMSNRGICYVRRVFSLYTATPASIHNINPVTDASWGDLTMVMYDADGDVTAVPAEAVKTVLDWEPTYDYEMISGSIDLDRSLQGGTTDAWFISAIGVPHYPPQYYGSIPFVSEVNLEAVEERRVSVDGRAVQLMAYNYGGAPHTNLMRFIFKHPAGAAKRFQIHIDHFV